MKNLKSRKQFIKESASNENYMEIGNTVKVGHKDHADYNRIGILTNVEHDQATVDLGTHIIKINVVALYDVSYGMYEKEKNHKNSKEAIDKYDL